MLEAYNNLAKEKQESEKEFEANKEIMENRIRELEVMVDEIENQYEEVLLQKTNEIEDLNNLLESKEKQIKISAKFLKDQTDEREQEREEYQNEILKLKGSLKNQERDSSSQDNMIQSIKDLEEQLNEYKNKYQQREEELNQNKIENQKFQNNLSVSLLNSY